MTRLAVVIVLTATAGIAAVVTHHPRRPASAGSAQLASVSTLPLPLAVRASRGEHRLPLLLGTATPSTSPRVVRRPAGPHPRPRPARPSSRSGSFSDVTMYCATGNRNAAGRWPQLGDVAVADRSIRFGTRVRIDGNVYTVEDWIGWGSQFDIYGGSDAGCEQRALTFGRKHLRVVVER